MILVASSERKLPIPISARNNNKPASVVAVVLMRNRARPGLADSAMQTKQTSLFARRILFWGHHMPMGYCDERTRRTVNTLDPLFV